MSRATIQKCKPPRSIFGEANCPRHVRVLAHMEKADGQGDELDINEAAEMLRGYSLGLAASMPPTCEMTMPFWPMPTPFGLDGA